jgi:hypothetical protein
MIPLRFPVPHEYFPVEHRFLELDGAQIDYVDEGSGDALLLLHGSWSRHSSTPKVLRVIPKEQREDAPVLMRVAAAVARCRVGPLVASKQER